MTFISEVNARLAVVLDDLRRELPDITGDVDHMVEPARRLLGGGKRARARLTQLGWAAATGEMDATHEPLPRAGAALELFQAAALVHDDIIDAADTRRGQPSVHRQFSAAHARDGLLGDAAGFGTSAALLVGDLLLALGQREITAAATGPHGPAALRVWDAMCAEVAVGQYLDIHASMLPLPAEGDAAAHEASIARALTVERHKSARYSVVHPLELGARLAGADDDLVASLRAYSEPLGIAFQLRDDDLGVFGDPARTGKPAGDDLQEGKRTPLVLIGLGRASGTDRERILGALHDSMLTSQDIADVQRILREVGAVEAHEALIAEHVNASRVALAESALDPAVRDRLEGMVERLTERDS